MIQFPAVTLPIGSLSLICSVVSKMPYVIAMNGDKKVWLVSIPTATHDQVGGVLHVQYALTDIHPVLDSTKTKILHIEIPHMKLPTHTVRWQSFIQQHCITQIILPASCPIELKLCSQEVTYDHMFARISRIYRCIHPSCLDQQSHPQLLPLIRNLTGYELLINWMEEMNMEIRQEQFEIEIQDRDSDTFLAFIDYLERKEIPIDTLRELDAIQSLWEIFLPDSLSNYLDTVSHPEEGSRAQDVPSRVETLFCSLLQDTWSRAAWTQQYNGQPQQNLLPLPGIQDLIKWAIDQNRSNVSRFWMSCFCQDMEQICGSVRGLEA